LGEKKLKCPNCNKEWIAEILWGYPEDTRSLEESLEKKEIVLGGCLVTNNDPRWECNNCNHKWGEREE
jgi:hypothetical protein